MRKVKNFIRNFTKGLVKFILFIAIFLFVLLAGTIVALQFSVVQTKITAEVTDYLSEKLTFPIHIDKVDINWFDVLVLEGVSIKDPQQGKMIYVGEVHADFQITSLHKAQFNIDEVILRNGGVKLIRHATTGRLNMNDFIDAIGRLAKGDSTNKKSSPFTVDVVQLENMYFSMDDNEEPHDRSGGFDHYHFAFDSVYGKVTNLLIVSDTFQIDVSDLRTIESTTKIRVHEVDTRYRITSKKMSFENLYAHIGKTEARDYFAFNYDKITDLADFNDKIIIEGDIKNSHVSFHDLSYFAPALKPFYENARIAGKFNGKVTRFTVSDLFLGFGRESFIKGKASFDGLPELDETFIELKFKNSTIHASDLKQYLDETSYPVLKKFGKIVGNGEYVGFFNDFVAKGNFNTDLGKIVSDINLKINNDKQLKTLYEGHLITESFDLGKLVNYPDHVQLLDMNGNIKGQGFSLQDAELKLKARISRIGLNNYDYRNITTNAQLSKSLFDGEIIVNDTNLRFTANGKVDLRENINEFKIKAHIEKANLKPLKLSSVETLFKSDVALNFTGIKPDDIEGDVRFINTYLLYRDNKEIFIDSLYAFSNKTQDRRTFGIKSDLIGMSAIGNFEFTTLAEDAETIYKEYLMTFENKSDVMSSYYKRKNIKNINKYNIDLYLNLKNINSLLAIYVPELYLSPGVIVQGNFSHGYTSILNLRTKIDTLLYKGNEVNNAFAEINTSKIADSSSILAMAHITSDHQKIQSFPETGNFMLEAIWAENKINFTTGLAEINSQNNGKIKGTLSFLPDQKELFLKPSSTFNLLNKVWTIPDNNKIIFSHEEITFQNFAISNDKQSLSLNGTISNNSDQEAILKIKNFKVETINPLLAETKIGGTLNGDIIIKDLYKDLNLGGAITLDTFLLNKFLIGNIAGKAQYDNVGKKLNINIEVEREKNTIVDLSGYIKPGPKGTSEELNLLAKLDNANLEILSPIFTGFLSDISGKATGDLKITGTVKDPLLTGKGNVKDGRLKVDYLGTTYYFEDYIYLDPDMIGFKKLKLRDEFGNKAIINGGIYHDSFRDYVVNVKGFLDHFMVLNTKEKDNELFYGEAIVTGDMEIMGAFENLQINANASSNKGTKIYIPLNGSEAIEQQNYITFKTAPGSKNKNKKDSIDLSGIRLNFNLNITPEAYVEIIFDKEAGDIIRGNGSGDLRLTIDTRGDFGMFGTYVITKGAYNFTLAGLINKEFDIGPNSTISWTGDPYEGTLGINAVYHEYASLKPLIEDSAVAGSINGKYPVDVLLGIQGNLMSPQINLGIDIIKWPANASPYVVEFSSKIKSNEQELNRQVFSLLMLRSFYRTDGTFAGVAGSGTNSGLSQLLSNQLSNWLSQVDENLTIDMNLSSLDKQALNTFQLRLSYTFLDGRLRISRDQGGFQNYQNTNQSSNVTNIAGEWTIEYLLSQDGRFRLKLYNKNNTNPLLASVVNTANTSAGFSLLHTQSFNNLKDLFTNKEKKQAQNSSEQKFLDELEKEHREKEAKQREQELLEQQEKEKRQEEEDKEKNKNETAPSNLNNREAVNPKDDDI